MEPERDQARGRPHQGKELDMVDTYIFSSFVLFLVMQLRNFRKP